MIATFNLTCVLNDNMPALVAQFPDIETMVVSNLLWNKCLDVYYLEVKGIICDINLYVVVNEGDDVTLMDIVYAKELVKVSIEQVLIEQVKTD